VVVVTATTGEPDLYRCLESVQRQSYGRLKHLVVVDGPDARAAVPMIEQYRNGDRQILELVLPENTGQNGFWGHRIYAASGPLCNADVVLYLDSDNWYDSDHVVSCITNMRQHGTDWTYSLRRIWSTQLELVAEDDSDSLGACPRYGTLLAPSLLSNAEVTFNTVHPHLVDTSCYAMRTELCVRIGPLWYFGHGADAVVATWLVRNHRVATTGRATVNYPLTSRTSAPPEWFLEGNRLMRGLYGDELPWRSAGLGASSGSRPHVVTRAVSG
jgi:glycosyltransferase involved in cell wall biosynthesis